MASDNDVQHPHRGNPLTEGYTMTVHELRTLLQAEDPNALVILQKESEGHGYSPLADIYPGAYVAETTGSGYIPDADEGNIGTPCIILAPIN
jgi:hypothetical protein